MSVDPQALRNIARDVEGCHQCGGGVNATTLRNAADEIERLKRRETDLLKANNRYLDRARKAEWSETAKHKGPQS